MTDLLDLSWEVMDAFDISPLGNASSMHMLGEGFILKEIFMFSKFEHNQWIR